MNQITQTEAAVNSYTAAQKSNSADKTDKTAKKSKVTNGATIGSPELSETAKKYYEQLKTKYSNMDFILVSSDKKEEAQANAGKYANASRMVVLIDEEKIERMAVDEDYRKKYESIISGATSQLSQLKDSLGANASSVKGYGMQVKDNGTASFFAVVDKSLAAQKKRIEKNAAKKAEEKKEAQKAAEEKRAEKRKAQKGQQAEKADKTDKSDDKDTVTITASSIEELIKKIQDTIYGGMSDYVQTEEESWVGGHVDIRY